MEDISNNSVDSESATASSSDASQQQSNSKTCAWCDAPRARNDLCNRCRQKVESRARRMMEQKLRGDVDIIHQISTFLQSHLALENFSAVEFNHIFVEIFPLLV